MPRLVQSCILLLLVAKVASWYDWNNPNELIEEHPHKVTKLPGAPAEPSFNLYAGHFGVSLDDSQHHVFYVLCEAIRADPLEAPLIVWLNGGPGASSLLGFSLENGPYLFNATTGGLQYNDLSWNQYANVLYIESPDGVGFSKSNRSEKRCDDESTANLTMAALREFFIRTHTRYATRDYFIAGESYAGIYIPYLTRAILRDDNFSNRNLRGIAMGNAEMDSYSRYLSSAIQMYSMGMLTQKSGPNLFKLWKNITDGDQEEFGKFYGLPSEYVKMALALNKSMYNLYLTCEKEEDEKIWHIPRSVKNMECTHTEYAKAYFNRADVQKALNVHKNGSGKVRWEPGSQSVKDAYVSARDIVPLYSEILPLIEGQFRILYYSGDLDLVCPAIHTARGARLIANRTGMKDTIRWRDSPKIWRYLGDFGGAQTSYASADGNVTMDVLTVRGAGHFAIVNHPSRTFQMIHNFLNMTSTPIDYSAKIRRRKYFVDTPKKSIFKLVNSFPSPKATDLTEGSGQSAEALLSDE